jgi:hypothetical protein
VIDDADVIIEVARWTSGRRGEPEAPDVVASADLTPFVLTSIAVGSRVLASTADSSSVTALSGTVAQLAERAETASNVMITDAKRATGEAVELTVVATREATVETAKIIDNASKSVQEQIGRTVKGGVETVERELERLLGGEKAPVVAAIKEVIGRAMGDAQVAWQSTLTTTLAQVSSTLDVSNPASPLGALERRLHEQQDRQHLETADRIERVQEVVVAMSGAAQTAAAVALAEANSPSKGLPFDEAVGAAAESVAAGMGATYTSTRDSVGAIRACKKGDGVLDLAMPGPGSAAARVVMEYTTSSARRNWAGYLDEAERNREAQASLGIVPSRDLVPGGELLAVLAPSRIVMAYEPGTDDHALFRGALQLLSVQAQRAVADGRSGDLGAVDAKLAEAKRSLIVMQDLTKTAATVRSGAGKVVAGLESLHSILTLCLEQAQAALGDATSAAE